MILKKHTDSLIQLLKQIHAKDKLVYNEKTYAEFSTLYVAMLE